MKTNWQKLRYWQQLRYGWGSIRKALETVKHTQEDVLSDLETDDERALLVLQELGKELDGWMRSADKNIKFCRNQELKEGE